MFPYLQLHLGHIPKVFSFGANVFGQLGHTPKTKQMVGQPTRVGGEIEFLTIVQIAAGGETSYALSTEVPCHAPGIQSRANVV